MEVYGYSGTYGKRRLEKLKEYHKIQTVFKRDPLTKHKTLIDGAFALPEFSYLRSNTWVFTEKIDGMNIRIMFDGETIKFGGKTDRAQIPAKLVAKLNDSFLPQIDLFKSVFAGGEVCLYGEGYGAKIQKGGGNYRQDQDFVLFDVLILTSYATYNSIKECPIHQRLLNATPRDFILLKGFVNPAIIKTLKNEIPNGQKGSKKKPKNTAIANMGKNKLENQQENVTLNQNSELTLKAMKDYPENKATYAPFVEKNRNGIAETENYSHSLLTIAIKQAELEGCFVALAILQFIKQNEILNGLQKQKCTCEINKGEWWLQRKAVMEIAFDFGLDVVPIIGHGTLSDMIQIAKEGFNSEWGNFVAEGIVARPATELKDRAGHRIITKIKHKDFRHA